MLLQNRFIKFLIVGISGTLIDFALFFLFFEIIGLGIIISNTISYGTGLTSSFFINRAWTFADSTEKSVNRLYLALFFGYLGLVINTAMVWTLAFIMPVFIGKVIAVFFIVIYNYLTNKYLVFIIKPKKPTTSYS